MNVHTIVKIDFCKSKIFSREMEADYPNIRTIGIKKLLNISCGRFPYGDTKFPEGSFYKEEGDAVYFILEKPTVAIRSSIEFMKEWYYEGLKQSFPECKVIIHRGILEKTNTPSGDDYLGKVFEEVSAVEKSLDDGKIYVSESTMKHADKTITKFVYYGTKDVVPGEKISLYYLAFSDPRTFEDDALAHILFIAHKESTEIRERIFRFFLIQYILDNGPLSDLSMFESWARNKGYPILPKEKIQLLLSDEKLFVKENIEGEPVFNITEDKCEEFLKAQEEYQAAVQNAIKTVSEEIVKVVGTKSAIDIFDIKRIMDEYLCGIFSEIRMIANYFKDTSTFYESDSDIFKRYNYILDRHLGDLSEDVASKWKSAFIDGLKKLAGHESIYISAIFHNILAGYYLNRSFHSSAYQIEKLTKRNFILDTNVLYSLKCNASNYHEKVKYFYDRLNAIGLNFRLYPFTVHEYESSLERVETEFKRNQTSNKLMRWNPWLYQEFRAHPHKYLNDISVCRIKCSLTQGCSICDDNLPAIQEELNKNNIILETEYKTFTEDETKELWEKLRSSMLKSGDIYQYWRFSEKMDKLSDGIIEHDVNLMENVKERYVEHGDDELGPLVLLITIDSKILKCRKEYPFVISPEQFLEFMMPYLFLSEIPESDPNRFPNQILSAHLGVHTSYWKPDENDWISMFFCDPDSFEDESGLAPEALAIAKRLSLDRLKEVVEKSQSLPIEEQGKLITQLTQKVTNEIVKSHEKALEVHKLRALEEKYEKEKSDKEKYKAVSEKLRRTLKYYKRVKRGK